MATTCRPAPHVHRSRRDPSAKLAALRQGPLPASAGDHEHRVTTFELLFDLAYVFAITQVSLLMASGHDALAVLRGLTVLALFWWSWAAYSWLSNHARADRGSVRVAMIVAMTAVFVAGLVVRESFDGGGARFAPLVLVSAYLVARVAHLVVYLLGAFEADGLRMRVVATGSLSVVPAAVALVAGALLGPPWQLPCWIAAAVYEPFAASLAGRGVDWRVRSVGHLAERHGLVVILALGESVIAIGSGVSTDATTPRLLGGAVLGVLLCVSMWWAYFSRLSVEAERRLDQTTGVARARLASLGYTYLHLVLVAAIVLTAFGVELAMGQVAERGPFGLFGAAVLGLGVATYLTGGAVFARVVLGRWWATRIVGAAALALSIPFVARIPAVTGLGVVLAATVAVLLSESRSAAAAP